MPGVTPAEVLSNFGITLVEDPAENQPRLLVDLPAAELVEHAIRREEGRMASNGALVIETGERTGRSPNDRFIVDTPDVHDKIAWGAVNRPLSVESYEAIKAGIVDYLNERDVFVTRGMAGADRNHTRRLLVACERASQALFIKQMLARPLAREIARTGEPDFCVLAAPGYQCDPAIKGLNSSAAVVINFQERVILVAGTGYSGEIKKSIFSVMNYLLPVEDDVLPMHDSYEEVKAINDDVIGWITIDGTVIDYPVVRAADNDYYLGRDVEKRKSAYGAIFMDFRNADPAQQKHIILYGHNMKNGTMFHDLMNYKQKSFFDEHRIIDLLWDGVDTQWEIFVAYIIKPNTIYHISTAFTDDQHFADVMNQTIEYAKTVKPSNADPDVTIKPSDQVLTLSTCTYEYDDSFFAVMARRIK